MISKAQAEVLRRMRDGEVLEKHSGLGDCWSQWKVTSKKLPQNTIDALTRNGFIGRESSIWRSYWTWCLTDAGRQALKEYEARQPCDVANGGSDASG